MRFVSALVVAVCSLFAARAYADGEAVNGFPNWQERVMHEWTNRARCDPQVEMTACGSACGDGACYTPQAPLPWDQALNHSARFHSDEMAAQVESWKKLYDWVRINEGRPLFGGGKNGSGQHGGERKA